MGDRILIIDDDEALRDSLALLLSGEGYEIAAAENGDVALRMIEEAPADIILCDLRTPGADGLALLPDLIRRLPGSTIITMSACDTDDLAIEAIQRGAYDYLAKPFQPSELLLALRKAQDRERLRRENRLLRRDVARAVGERAIVAASSQMIDLLETLERVAAFESTVLLTGESGTGKEVLARAIHAQSPRRSQSFVRVNCAAIPEARLESELFGHTKGAFTGADRARRGLFQEADGGTIFLDEIAELPTALQAKLVRVLQEEEIRPVGESKPRSLDIRVLAATARNLDEAVAAGRFRDDLFYRLNVFRLAVPALRERRKDIPLLVDLFLESFREALGVPIRGIAEDALARLVAYHWPGNVRELENVIERAMIVSSDDRITTRDLPQSVSSPTSVDAVSLEDLCMKRARRALEADLIRRALRATNGNRTHAAKRLEISHRALLYKLKEYAIRD